MTGKATVSVIATGTYRVDDGTRSETVYVAGAAGDEWAFWRGRVFRIRRSPARTAAEGHVSPAHPRGRQILSAPMPATVLAINVTAGDRVRAGATLVVLEAMKMELPVRSELDAVVSTVHCHVGEIVKPDAPLVELE